MRENLMCAFPSKTPRERRQIASRFYRYFYDLIFESIRIFSISEKEATARFKVVNPEALIPLAQANQSAILTGGHYTNWELFAVATNPQITHQLLGIYTPLTNRFMERKFSASRSRFGLQLVPKKELKEVLENTKDLLAISTFAIDQSPRKDQKAYWMQFLGNETAVHFGAEKYARAYNYPVVYGRSLRVKRGYYELTFELLTENPSTTKEGEITEKNTRRLEQQILEAPEYWLWTHKRWKLKKELKSKS